MPLKLCTKAQVKTIRSLAHGRLGWSNEGYHTWLTERGWAGSTLDLSVAQAANVIDMLKAMANGLKVRVWHVDQATLQQQGAIWKMAQGLPPSARIGGVVMRATKQRTDQVAQLTIVEAKAVIEALRSIGKRGAA